MDLNAPKKDLGGKKKPTKKNKKKGKLSSFNRTPPPRGESSKGCSVGSPKFIEGTKTSIADCDEEGRRDSGGKGRLLGGLSPEEVSKGTLLCEGKDW